MDFNDYHKRDGYDLQYNRSSAPRLPSAREYAEPGLDDRQLLKYSKLEKQVEEIVNHWNSVLNEESKELRSILDEAHFLFQRLKELNPGSILDTSPPTFLPLGFEPRRDATNELTVLYNRKKEAERHRDELSQKLESLLVAKSQTFQGVKGDQGDTLLYRVQVHPYSCLWSQQPHRNAYNPSGTKKYPLGYRCSGWDSCSPITNKDIINHMNKVKVGTPLISVSESPDRLMKILDQISKWDEHATVIEVFSLWMLQHIGVLQARSTDICDKRGIPRVNGEDVPGAARWTTDTHRLVLHWIPDEALVATMTPQEFRAVAKNRYLTKADFPKASLATVQKPIQTPNHVSQLPEQFRSLGLSSGNTPQEAIDLTIASKTQIQPAEQAIAPTASSNLVPPQPTPTPVTEQGLKPTILPQSKATEVTAKSELPASLRTQSSTNSAFGNGSPPAVSVFGQPSTNRPLFGADKETSRISSVFGDPSTTPVQSNTKSAFGTGSLFGDYKPIPRPLFSSATGAAPAAGGEQLFGQAKAGANEAPAGSGGPFGGFQPTPRPAFSFFATGTATVGAAAPSTVDMGPFGQSKGGTNVPTASSGLFSSFQPTPRPAFSFATDPFSSFATGTATAGATAPSTADKGPFGQATAGANVSTAGSGLFSSFQPTPRPASSFATGTTTATGGVGLFGQATMGTNTPAARTGGLFGQASTASAGGGLFGQAPTASGVGGLFGQARTETGASLAADGSLFDQAATGTNSTTGGGGDLFGQATTGANAPTDSSGGPF